MEEFFFSLFSFFLSFLNEIILSLFVVVLGIFDPRVNTGNNESNPQDGDEVPDGVNSKPDPGPDFTELVSLLPHKEVLNKVVPLVNEGAGERPHDGEGEETSGEFVVEEGEHQPSPGNTPPGLSVGVDGLLEHHDVGRLIVEEHVDEN